jgi:hypothetical protein
VHVTANLDVGNMLTGLAAAGAWFSAHRAHLRAIQVDEKVKTINGKTIGQIADDQDSDRETDLEARRAGDTGARPQLGP